MPGQDSFAGAVGAAHICREPLSGGATCVNNLHPYDPMHPWSFYFIPTLPALVRLRNLYARNLGLHVVFSFAKNAYSAYSNIKIAKLYLP